MSVLTENNFSQVAGTYAASYKTSEDAAKGQTLQDVLSLISGMFAPAKNEVQTEKYPGVSPNAMTVSKEELENIMKGTVNEDEGITVQTPKDEAAIIEGLLGMSPGQLGDSMVQFVKGYECCENCGRHFSFLDIITTGLGVHSKQFLNSVLSGKYGCLMNYTPPQVHRCYGCNKPSGAKSLCYGAPTYACGCE